MKKSVCFALICLLSISVQGCAGQQTESETQTETQKQTELETLREVETESEPETETEEAEKEEDLRVGTIIGSLVDIDMEQITVLSDNGNEIILPIKEAELDFSGGFRVGNLVSVNYTGEILETDNRSADIAVLRAADSSDVQELEVSALENEKEAEAESGGESESESGTEEGTEGESESGTEENTEGESESGLEEDTEQESESPTAEVQTIRGEIQNLDRNSMTILTDDKEELTFGIMNVQMYFSKGMAKGTKVVISYTGELTGENQGVVSVTDAASFKEKENE